MTEFWKISQQMMHSVGHHTGYREEKQNNQRSESESSCDFQVLTLQNSDDQWQEFPIFHVIEVDCSFPCNHFQYSGSQFKEKKLNIALLIYTGCKLVKF